MNRTRFSLVSTAILTFEPTRQEFSATADGMQQYISCMSKDQSAVEDNPAHV